MYKCIFLIQIHKWTILVYNYLYIWDVVFTHRRVSLFCDRRNWKKWWSGVGKVLREQKRWVWRFSAQGSGPVIFFRGKSVNRKNVPKNGRLKLGGWTLDGTCEMMSMFMLFLMFDLYVQYMFLYTKSGCHDCSIATAPTNQSGFCWQCVDR